MFKIYTELYLETYREVQRIMLMDLHLENYIHKNIQTSTVRELHSQNH